MEKDLEKVVKDKQELNQSIKRLKFMAGLTGGTAVIKGISVVSPKVDTFVFSQFNSAKVVATGGTHLLGVYVPNWFVAVLIAGILVPPATNIYIEYKKSKNKKGDKK